MNNLIKILDILYSRILFIKYYFSKNKNFIYRTALCKNTILRGHNVLFHHVIVDSCDIGEFTYIQSDSRFVKSKIGKYCSIADNVRVVLGSHPTNIVSTYPSFYYDTTKELRFTFYEGTPKFVLFKTIKDGDGQYSIIVGNDVWIGSHVIILDGVRIGDGAIIAAGAVVTDDVAPYAIYGGVPAKKIRSRFPKEIVEKLQKSKWWNKDEKWIREHAYLFDNVDIFLDSFNKMGDNCNA